MANPPWKPLRWIERQILPSLFFSPVSCFSRSRSAICHMFALSPRGVSLVSFDQALLSSPFSLLFFYLHEQTSLVWVWDCAIVQDCPRLPEIARYCLRLSEIVRDCPSPICFWQRRGIHPYRSARNTFCRTLYNIACHIIFVELSPAMSLQPFAATKQCCAATCSYLQSRSQNLVTERGFCTQFALDLHSISNLQGLSFSRRV